MAMSRNIFALVAATLVLGFTAGPRAHADAASESGAPLQASAQMPASAPLQSSAIVASSVEAALPPFGHQQRGERPHRHRRTNPRK